MKTFSLQQRLLPDAPRDFPGRRVTRSVLRTVHILGGGVLIGAYLFQQPQSSIHLWYITATLSGMLLFLTDLHASFAVLFEWRGLSIISKICLLLLLPLMPGYEIYILSLILAIGSLSSHLSRKFRHRLWLKLPDITQDQRRG
ncbi:MAG: hypothetical protein GY726_07925 [Proteobacteria bacterium]|nr:hypothetical protein [Pseudomonadota bacterium]